MIYSLSLRAAGLLVALLLISTHIYAFLKAGEVRKFLQTFPRSQGVGRLLLVIDAIWAFFLILSIDLGEFTSWRTTILIGIIVATALTILFVEEFIAVRALGILFLLAAEPILEATFLKPQSSRILLNLLAYAWATIGMFWVGVPYLLRDQIDWVSRSDARWKIATLGGVVYGIVLLGCALVFWG